MLTTLDPEDLSAKYDCTSHEALQQVDEDDQGDASFICAWCCTFQTLDTVSISNIDQSIILVQRGRAYMSTNKCIIFLLTVLYLFTHVGYQFSVHRDYGNCDSMYTFSFGCGWIFIIILFLL